jgi:hypothetical protein
VVPPERGYSVGHPDKPVTAHIGPSDPIVPNLDADHPVLHEHPDLCVSGVALPVDGGASARCFAYPASDLDA